MSDIGSNDLQRLNEMIAECSNFNAGPTFTPPVRGGSVKSSGRTTKTTRGGTRSDTRSAKKRGSSSQPPAPQRELRNRDHSWDSLPSDSAEFEGDFKTFLKANIIELRNNNRFLATLFQRQQHIIVELTNDNAQLKDRVEVLEAEIDDLKQEKLSHKLIISGPSIENFISQTPEHLAQTKNLGANSIHKLKSLIATKTLKDSDPLPPNVTEIPQDQPSPAIAPLAEAQGITAAYILSENRLAVESRDKASAMRILTRGKITNRTLFFAEQLTKRRQGLMFDMRRIRNSHPGQTQIAIFSRNGTPAYRRGEEPFTFVRNSRDVGRFAALLAGREDLPAPPPGFANGEENGTSAQE